MPQFPNPNNSTGSWSLEKQRNAVLGKNWGSPLIATTSVVPYLIDVSYGLVHDRVIAFAGKVHF
jgi:hypothetical protein